MFFWSIEALKAELREGPLAQSHAFAYVFVGFFLVNAMFGIPGLWNVETPVTLWAWVTYVVTLALFAGGTNAAYRVNGGAEGLDFVARYLALSWVLGIRLFVLVLVPLLGLVMVAFVVLALAQTDAATATAASEDLAAEFGVADREAAVLALQRRDALDLHAAHRRHHLEILLDEHLAVEREVEHRRAASETIDPRHERRR